MDENHDIARFLNQYEAAYEKYLNRYKAALVKEGTKAYIQGDLKAQKALGVKLSFNLVNKEALKYITKYKKELEKGGSTIQGKWTPWLENMAKDDRAAVAKILQDGYKAGKPTGVKQYKNGGYPKNSIAADLKGYFNDRKSHAATVARTEIARIQVHGSLTRYQQQKVKRVMWLVFNPCHICEQYSRQVFDIDKVPREIPAHPNCRCALAPVPDEVPEGPAPDQEIPEVFERDAEAMPAGPTRWEVETVKTYRASLPYEAPTVDWEPYGMKVINKFFDQAEGDGLQYYIGSGYEKINTMLRGRDPAKFTKWLTEHDYTGKIQSLDQAEAYIKDKLEPMAAAIEKALDKSALPEEVILYRSPGRTIAQDLIQHGEAIDRGFMSTSSKFNSSYSAFGRADKEGYKNIIVVRGKEGDKALYINTGENEVLYQKDQRLKLLGIREVDTVEMNNAISERPYTANKVRFLFCKIIPPE